jgi:hypothetical protein
MKRDWEGTSFWTLRATNHGGKKVVGLLEQAGNVPLEICRAALSEMARGEASEHLPLGE